VIAAIVLSIASAAGAAGAADWPTVRGGALRDGFTPDRVDPPYAKAWSRHWPGEAIATRVEAIVAGGRVFVGTSAGRLHALDAATGADLWTFEADGPILHSPSCEGDSVYLATASPGRTVYRLAAADGSRRFERRCGPGGFSASPLVAGGKVLIGGRDGVFHALDAASGDVLWTIPAGGPIRTTAAASGNRVFFAADDLRAYAVEAAGGRLLWRSERLFGQSLRDYYPVVLGDRVVFRTNPMEQMGVYNSRTGALVVKAAGIADPSSPMKGEERYPGWKTIDAWVKEGKTRGSPEAFERERRAVLGYLEEHAQARTFHVLDAATGKEAIRAPVLWAAGCQGVGVPPVRDGKGRTIAFTRSAYGNWTLGVAPLVGLQILDLASPQPPEPALGPLPTAASEPIFHSKGNGPPWNTFWGTADETTNYSVGGGLLYLCHQGTLGAFDLETRDLFPVAGARDTWGGEKGLPWARNEWHGPARGSLAIAGDSLYWVVGSRVIAIRGKGRGPAGVPPRPVPAKVHPDGKTGDEQPGSAQPPHGAAPEAASKPLPPAEDFIRYVYERPVAPIIDPAASSALREELERRVREVLDRPDLAPLLVEAGLGSHDFAFDTSAAPILALAWAYPHLGDGLKARARERARKEVEAHPPCGKESRYRLDGPERREPYTLTPERFYVGWEKREDLPEAYALDLWADRTGDVEPAAKAWPRARRAFEVFEGRGWRLDPAKGDRFANAFAAGLIGAARLARRFGDGAVAERAERLAAGTLRAIAEHWTAGLEKIPGARAFEGVGELDRFIGGGDVLFFKVVPHRSKIAKVLDLVPEVGRAVRETVPGGGQAYLQAIDAILPLWHLAFEERQVHTGENWIDFPDQAAGIFRARAHIALDGRKALEDRLDIPWCPGDLSFIEKLVLAIEAP
jgi:hypothetical protein